MLTMKIPAASLHALLLTKVRQSTMADDAELLVHAAIARTGCSPSTGYDIAHDIVVVTLLPDCHDGGPEYIVWSGTTRLEQDSTMRVELSGGYYTDDRVQAMLEYNDRVNHRIQGLLVRVTPPPVAVVADE